MVGCRKTVTVREMRSASGFWVRGYRLSSVLSMESDEVETRCLKDQTRAIQASVEA